MVFLRKVVEDADEVREYVEVNDNVIFQTLPHLATPFQT